MTNEAEKIAESITIEEKVVLLHTVAQKIEAQDTGEVTKRGGGRTNLADNRY